jgi:hypothetical protein
MMVKKKRDPRLNIALNETFNRLDIDARLDSFVLGMGGNPFIMEINNSANSYLNLMILNSQLKKRQSSSYSVTVEFSLIDEKNPGSKMLDGFGVFLLTKNGLKDYIIFQIDNTATHSIISEAPEDENLDLDALGSLVKTEDTINKSIDNKVLSTFIDSKREIIKQLVFDFVHNKEISYQ